MGALTLQTLCWSDRYLSSTGALTLQTHCRIMSCMRPFPQHLHIEQNLIAICRTRERSLYKRCASICVRQLRSVRYLSHLGSGVYKPYAQDGKTGRGPHGKICDMGCQEEGGGRRRGGLAPSRPLKNHGCFSPQSGSPQIAFLSKIYKVSARRRTNPMHIETNPMHKEVLEIR